MSKFIVDSKKDESGNLILSVSNGAKSREAVVSENMGIVEAAQVIQRLSEELEAEIILGDLVQTEPTPEETTKQPLDLKLDTEEKILS